MIKICNICNTSWKTSEDFIRDQNIEIIGYQSNFKKLELGFFLFNHICGTTIALKVKDFLYLYTGEIFEEKKNTSSVCPGYCMLPHELRPCPEICECAYVRNILQIIKNRNI